jgi:hypothetical protein
VSAIAHSGRAGIFGAGLVSAVSVSVAAAGKTEGFSFAGAAFSLVACSAETFFAGFFVALTGTPALAAAFPCSPGSDSTAAGRET